MGFKTYSANPKLKAAQPSIMRSHQAGHGRVLNVHRESKGESITQNANWLQTGQKPKTPAAVSRQRYQQRKQRQAQQQQQNQQSQSQNQQSQSQKPPTQSQNQATGVAAGKATHAVNGQDLAGKFQFKGTSQYSIEQVIQAQGFDGKPTLTSDKAAFASACKASNFIAKRGVGASDQRTLDAYDQALKTGEFYVKCRGGSVHGYGMYAASVAANGKSAASGISDAEYTAKLYAAGNRSQKIYTMTLDRSAKIGNESAIKRQMNRDTAYQKMCQNSTINWRYTQDVGVYAAYKGYDAYIAKGGRKSTDGSSSDYTVILNRSKVIIYDPTV